MLSLDVYCLSPTFGWCETALDLDLVFPWLGGFCYPRSYGAQHLVDPLDADDSIECSESSEPQQSSSEKSTVISSCS